MARPMLDASQRDARRRAILDAADTTLQAHGLLALQIAAIARCCGCSTGTIYQYFASKEDLLLSLAARDLTVEQRVFERLIALDHPTRDTMLLLAWADHRLKRDGIVNFALRQYVTTQVVWNAATDSTRQAVLEAGRAIGQQVDTNVERALSRGDLPAVADAAASGGHDSGHRQTRHTGGTLLKTPSAIGTGPWSLVIGMQTLMNATGLLEFYAVERPDALMVEHLECLLDGLGWRPVRDPAASTRDHDTRARLDDTVSQVLRELALEP